MAQIRNILFVIPLLTLGCSERPKAPPLIREAMYQNAAIGLKFMTPNDWALVSRANLPSGPLPKPIVLVSYIQNRGDQLAELSLVAADVPENADLGPFLADYRIGAETWTPTKTVDTVPVIGAEGRRYSFVSRDPQGESRREATAFRRGGRAYIFFVTYKNGDTDNRDVGRKAVASATWL